jgi:hypothetical protein
MQAFRCWSAESVAETVFSDIGALSGDADAVFLAAHTPVRLEHLKGSEIAVHQSGERQVLDALLQRVGDLERNTLVAVTGGSGSGKSHVVRWVHAHIDKNDARYAILYVPRVVQTIRELLHRIVEGLPGVEGEDLLERVDQAVSGKLPGELQDSLVAQMRIDLNWTIEDQIAYEGEPDDEARAREDRNLLLGDRDEDGRRRDGLADLLEIATVNRTLVRTDGALRQLVESYYKETSRRDENDRIFSKDDLPLRERGVLGSLASRPELRELWQLIAQDPRDAISLLEEALRSALPKVLGLRSNGGETLDALFRESRRALRRQGRELVLVFEDLAQFGLVDAELYNQFVTPPGDDLAPLRVVFAITTGAYGEMERTVRTRVEHEFRVGGSALSDPRMFVGRYLNLVRVGRDESQSLWRNSGGPDASTPWMKNACDTIEAGLPCQFRDVCHASFGSVEIPELGNVGLYPYSDPALRRSISHLGDDPTPREVLDQSIWTTLVEADGHIERGTYPHERTKQQFDFFARMPKDALLQQFPSSDPERTYRALVVWGDENALPEGILSAFSLDTAQPQRPPVAQYERPMNESAPQVATDLPNPLLPLFQWQNGAELPEDEVVAFRNALYELTASRLGLDQYMVHVHSGRGKQLLDDLFNVTSFSLEGARGRRAGENSVGVELRRNAEDVQTLAAARWFKDHGHFVPARGLWEWPGAYDPARLMVDLEVRLDSWANTVRERFLMMTGGSLIAQDGLGVRALALAIAGCEPSELETAASVLSATRGQTAASGTWEVVDWAARRVLASFAAEELIGEFSAVRQGETGQPQLVDTRDLDTAIAEFLVDPQTSLTRVAETSNHPVLRQGARELLSAVSGAAGEQVNEISKSTALVAELLEGLTPSQVGDHASEVGRSAREAGLFRPSEGWQVFQRATDFLSQHSERVDPLDVRRGFNDLVLKQEGIRRTEAVARALGTVKQAMAATKGECERSGGDVGDASRLQGEAKHYLAELTRMLNELTDRP